MGRIMVVANKQDCGKCLSWDGALCLLKREPDNFGYCTDFTNKHILKAFGWLTAEQERRAGLAYNTTQDDQRKRER